MRDNRTNSNDQGTLPSNKDAPPPLLDNPGTSPFLFPYQRGAFNELEGTAQVFAQAPWYELPIRPRFHRLIVAPTGMGKTHLVRALAEKLRWPFLSLTASNWILLGSSERGGKQTWPLIASWLSEAATHRILFVDEIEKIGGIDTWSRHLRCEVFNLLDHAVPPGLVWDEESDSGDCVTESTAVRRMRVINTLRFRTLIVAGAAFQDVWETRSHPNIGFHSPEVTPQSPSQNELAGHLSRELVNRWFPPSQTKLTILARKIAGM